MTRGCVVGIDPGERWVGVARAAHGSDLALPLGTIDRSAGEASTADELKSMLGGETVAQLVVGVPLRPDGREDAQAAAFRQFGETLAASLGAVCVAQDERFSSELASFAERQREAAERQREADGAVGGRKTRAQGRKSVQRQRRERERSHANAAARILQRWLDSREGLRARGIADRGG